MPLFDEADLDKLANLCQIECSAEEKKALCQHISRVLDYMTQLGAVDTADVAPCFTVLDGLTNVLREDAVKTTLSREDFLSNAPAHVGGMIRTPPVMK
jgi:aspartyl-tRNA(Asn)/glutamyl-tRNA(Gln) amidotransferase subunit C